MSQATCPYRVGIVIVPPTLYHSPPIIELKTTQGRIKRFSNNSQNASQSTMPQFIERQKQKQAEIDIHLIMFIHFKNTN